MQFNNYDDSYYRIQKEGNFINDDDDDIFDIGKCKIDVNKSINNNKKDSIEDITNKRQKKYIYMLLVLKFFNKKLFYIFNVNFK